MKKITTLIVILFIGKCTLRSQTSLIINETPHGYTISNGQVLYFNVAAKNLHDVFINIKNTSTTTKSYKMKMIKELRNVVAPGDLSVPYFAFAMNCLNSDTYISPSSETLNAGQSTDASIGGNGHQIYIHFLEASIVGVSKIRYCIFDFKNPSDSISFTLIYNDPTISSIESNKSPISTISDVFPNPSDSKNSININTLADLNNVSILITNSIGSIVSKKNVDLMIENNTIDLNSQILSNGIYFVSIAHSNFKTAKKFIINN